MAQKRHNGHYCWACDRRRANEKFSGRGHARQLCKDCARLGKEELAYRQAIRDMEQLVTWEGVVPRKKRQQFQKYLEHENERVRAYALEIEAAGAVARAEERLACELDELSYELAEEGVYLVEVGDPSECDPEYVEEVP
jgi:hypothetical protein